MESAGAPWDRTRAQVWEPASEAFAEGASGTPGAHVNNLNPGSVRSETEFPTLMSTQTSSRSRSSACPARR